MRRLGLLLAVALLLITGGVATSHAIAPIPGSAYPQWASASYRGWAYSSTSSSSTAWKWTTTGWVRSSFVPGTSFFAVPFGSGWTWAWRDTTWYAVRTTTVAKWQCVGPADVGIVNKKAATYRYNTTASTLKGYLAPSTRVNVACENIFASASISYGTMFIQAPAGYLLVWAQPQPGCTIPEHPGDPICMIAVMPSEPQRVYVRFEDISSS
jgi:hypothetical protein